MGRIENQGQISPEWKMRTFVFIASLALSVAGTSIATADPVTDTPVVTAPGKDVQLGAYTAFKQDCSGGHAAQVRPAGDQHGGTLVLRHGSLATTRVPNCGKGEAPAQIIIYRPNPGFTGTDTVTYDVMREYEPASG